MNTQTEVFVYEGNNVTFQVGEGIVANATQMAKPFGKKVSHWLQLDATKEYLAELVKGRDTAFLVKTVKGRTGGTYIDERLIIEFARWLSPAFSIWCNARIKELMTHGFTATSTTLEDLIDNPDMLIQLASKLKASRAAQAIAEQRSNELEQAMVESTPKVLFADSVAASKDTILIGDLAKLIKQNGVDIGQNRMFTWLRENGYLVQNDNIPTQKSMNLGLFEVKEYTISDSDGNVKIRRTPKVTGKGQIYLMQKFLKNSSN